MSNKSVIIGTVCAVLGLIIGYVITDKIHSKNIFVPKANTCYKEGGINSHQYFFVQDVNLDYTATVVSINYFKLEAFIEQNYSFNNSNAYYEEQDISECINQLLIITQTHAYMNSIRKEKR